MQFRFNNQKVLLEGLQVWDKQGLHMGPAIFKPFSAQMVPVGRDDI